MVRGIERRFIFKDKSDKQSFLRRFESVIAETGTICYAYALMDNHVHLLLQTAETPISKVMQSLLTGYAVNYNYRHKRIGRLYQNRFKSVLCDKDEYFLQLVRYIHLNPLRVKRVKSILGLDRYPWTGHSILMGQRKAEWFDSGETLAHFGRSITKARQDYRAFVGEGLSDQDQRDLSGGGFLRSLGGEWELQKAAKGTKQEEKEAADERILGMGEFVEAVLQQADQKESRTSILRRSGWTYEKVQKRVCKLLDLSVRDLRQRGIKNNVSKGRALLGKWVVDDLGESQAFLADALRISRPAAHKLVKRGREVERELRVKLDG
ncbi:transposase [Planctomycetota bacterium]